MEESDDEYLWWDKKQWEVPRWVYGWSDQQVKITDKRILGPMILKTISIAVSETIESVYWTRKNKKIEIIHIFKTCNKILLQKKNITNITNV